jgi:hypothetical protein
MVGTPNWQYYPKQSRIPTELKDVISIFEKNLQLIDSSQHKLGSNDVLKTLSKDLTSIGYRVESGKGSSQKNSVPVLFGRNGRVEKSFDADAYNEGDGTVVEIEAGRGVTNYQFLKDLFQACVMCDVNFLVIAVRNIYRKRRDFDTVVAFMDSLFVSRRLNLPLKGVLVIGY